MNKEKFLTSDEIAAYLESKNPQQFEGILPADPHTLLITGEFRKTDDTTIVNYELISKPPEAARKVKIMPGKYYRALALKQVDLSTGFQGSKRAVAANIFQSAQPLLYQFVEDQLRAKNYTWFRKGTNNTDDPPVVKLNLPVYGSIVTLRVPNHVIHTVRDGERKPLIAGRYNAYTKRYEEGEANRSYIRFFADEDDLGNLMDVAVNAFERDVEPYATGDTQKIRSLAGKLISQSVEGVVKEPTVQDEVTAPKADTSLGVGTSNEEEDGV